jgi:hypothetical protein
MYDAIEFREDIAPAWLISIAREIADFKGRVRNKDRRILVYLDGEIAGFFTPHLAKDGALRVGPVFVREHARRRGVLRKIYREYGTGKLCRAFILDHNETSRAAHERIGFVRKRRGRGGWFYERDQRGVPTDPAGEWASSRPSFTGDDAGAERYCVARDSQK